MQVKDAAELEATLAGLLENKPRRAQLGHNAVKVVRENLGGIERTVEMIMGKLGSGEFYVPREDGNVKRDA